MVCYMYLTNCANCTKTSAAAVVFVNQSKTHHCTDTGCCSSEKIPGVRL